MTQKKETSAIQARTRVKKKLLLTALESSFGIISKACHTASISRETYYRWNKNENFRKACEERIKIAEQTGLDYAESKLFSLIGKEEPSAIYFYLKCKGKHRGYVEKTESHLSGELKISVVRKTITG